VESAAPLDAIGTSVNQTAPASVTATRRVISCLWEFPRGGFPRREA